MQNAERLMSPTTPPLKYAPGPHQRAFEAEQLLQNALTSGDPRKIRDAEIYSAKTRAARDKADAPPKTKNDLMFEAFISSRIGPGGQLLPLISKLKAAGTTQQQLQQHFIGMGADPDMAAKIAPMAARIAANALPIALAATGVAAGVAGVAMVTNRALEMNRASGSAYWTGGGSARATGQGMALSNFVGKDLGSAAVGFGDQLRQGSYGAGYFRSRGITDLGPYTTDKTSNYIRGIDELRRIKSDQEAIRIARDTGMTDELRYRDLSDPTYERLKRSMGDRATPEARKAAAEFDANKAEFDNQWDKFTAEIGNTFIPAGTAFTQGLNNTTDPDFWRLDFANKDWRVKHGIKWYGDDDPSPSEKNAQAAQKKDMNRQLKDGTEQIGGGNRANGIPAGWSSSWKLQNTDEALKAQTVMMGGFAVG